MSLSASQIQALVDGSGYGAMFESYEQHPMVFPRLCEVVEINPDPDLYGDKGSVIMAGEPFKERRDGQEIEASSMGQAGTWYCRIGLYSRRLDIPRRLANRVDAVGKVESLIAAEARKWGEMARLQKDDFVAGMFQKGTLTAGSAKYFDGSFDDRSETDPNPKFIYDGLPWFDGAHTQYGGSSTFSNIATGNALTSANLQTGIITVGTTNAKDEQGNRVRIQPNTLVVPPNLEFTARTILESVGLPGSAQNDANVTRGVADLVVWHALTDDTDAWWLGEAGKGIRAYDSGAPIMEVGYDPLKKQFFVTAEYAFGAVVTNWRHWYSANKADS